MQAENDSTPLERAGFLSQKTVLDLLDNPSRAVLRNWERTGRFPKRLQLGERRVAWRKAEVLDYLEDPEGWRERHREGRT
ncbi:AlpA family transcriptional regulator [Thioalkalivibrio sp. ALE21]|uniref:helix-turn-helix transcriptional regulator n=1 Tax=Thioalkalivibrio sp. ALE21 TaxID=1158175 RepID=UPI000D90B61E|nr:AlpA family phage regulatory protein [Thioalkalivibrio sp. ALE21]PYG00746.1 AlpA family transcriptional regulator [Thioalkalivibrio sp. ALE21]